MPLGSDLPEPITIQTPAKINFFLSVQKKRNDGYHELFMDLVPISLFDTLSFQPIRDGGAQLKSDFRSLSQEKNLVIQALRCLENSVQRTFSIQIVLKKTIPTGAGLGGGSGNAAGTLVALNHIYKLGLSQNSLAKLALSLGADVPFFLEPKPSIARGIGEKLSPVESFEPLSLLLLYPDFSISTIQAYKNCILSNRKEGFKNYSFSSIKKVSVEDNDFWPRLSVEYPMLKECQKKLLESGAEGVGFSGSGSTLFGVFPDSKKRDQSFAMLQKNRQWTVFCCETINRHHYFPLL